MEHKIVMGKGKEYSKVSREVERNFRSWLVASSVSEDEFLKAVEVDDFMLNLYSNGDRTHIVFHNANGYIAAPLMWRKESGIAYEEFKTDAGLLLFAVVGKCKKEESKQKIRKFIRDELYKNCNN